MIEVVYEGSTYGDESETHSIPSLTSEMEPLAKILTGWNPVIIFAKISISDVPQALNKSLWIIWINFIEWQSGNKMQHD